MKAVLQFIRDLTQNNDRAWFQANKERYEGVKKQHEQFVKDLIHSLGMFDPEVVGLEVKDTVFRIYRDTRFSHDKSPYKNHIGAYLAKGGRKSSRAGYYLHLEPDNCFLAGGIWCPEPALLKALREDVYNNADEFRALLSEPAFKNAYELSEEDKLKKVPTAFPKDAPNSDLVKYKSYTAIGKVPESFFDGADVLERTVERLALLAPLNRFLNATVDESI